MAKYLARRYGYSPELVEPARRRLVEILGVLDGQLARAGGPYFFGAHLTALDFYSAAALVLPLRRYSLISSTVFFTDWKDFSNIAFSSAVRSIWSTFSTPPEPITTGTPM